MMQYKHSPSFILIFCGCLFCIYIYTPGACIDQKEASDPLKLEFQAVIILFVLLTLCSFKKHLYACHEFLPPTFSIPVFFFPFTLHLQEMTVPGTTIMFPFILQMMSSMKTSHNTPVIGHNPPLRYILPYILSIMKHFRMHGAPLCNLLH